MEDEKKTRKPRKKKVDKSVENVEKSITVDEAFMVIAKDCIEGHWSKGETRQAMINNKLQSCINSLLR